MTRSTLVSRALLASLLCAGVFVAHTDQAAAEPRPERVPSPGRSAASSDDGTALALNPANLSFLPGTDFRWTWVRPGNGSTSPARGHSFSLAGALPFGLGTGIRMDFVRPAGHAPAPFDKPYTWLTWGLSLGNKDSSLGLGVNHIYSNSPDVGGLTSWTLGWTGRADKHLSLAAVAHDLNAPRARYGEAYLDRSFTFGASLRPLGTRSLELGLEGQYYPSVARIPGRNEHWLPRAVVGVDVPYVGRLRGDLAVLDAGTEANRAYVASATLDVPLGYSTLTGGTTFGSGIGGRDGAGFIGGLSLQSWLEPGIPTSGYAVVLRMDRTPSVRGHVHLLRKLWRMAEDNDLKAVVLHVKASPAASAANADELDDAVRLLQANGKKVVCHLEDAGGRAMHVCAHADRIVLNPAGGLRFAGLAMQHMYFAGLLQKLGVRAQFVRIGDFKSAPEQFTNTGPSDPARLVTEDNLGQIEREYVNVLAHGRRIAFDEMRRTISAGPFTAREALRDHLVDGFAYDDELRTVASEVVGRPIALLEHTPDRTPRAWGSGGRSVAIVYVEGSIVDGRSQSIPLIGMKTVGSYTIAEALKAARDNPSVGAVVLRIDSPGGSSMAADVMWREVELTAREKPLIVSMAGVAASGGYYIAVPAKKIYASPFTVTGSIGIFYGKADVQQLFAKLGISVHTTKTAPRADAESVFRPFTDDEVKELGGKVKQFYDVFIDRVARGRKMTPDAADAVARGRVWMGRAAKDRHLIDEIGGLRQALTEAQTLAGVGRDAPIIELPRPEFSLLELVADLSGAQLQADRPLFESAVPAQLGDVLRAAAPFLIYDPEQPMALSEIMNAP